MPSVVIGQPQSAHGPFAAVVDPVDERGFEVEEVGHGAGEFFEGAHAVAVGDGSVGVAEVALLVLRAVHGGEERGHGVADVVEAELLFVRPGQFALPDSLTSPNRRPTRLSTTKGMLRSTPGPLQVHSRSTDGAGERQPMADFPSSAGEAVDAR